MPVAIDFGRANLELAGLLIRQNRIPEAIAVLRPASRGWFLETSNMHITLTDVHDRLAQAWSLLGQADSAASHRSRVAESWRGADREYLQRRRARSPSPEDRARL